MKIRLGDSRISIVRLMKFFNCSISFSKKKINSLNVVKKYFQINELTLIFKINRFLKRKNV
jgi:hypothetical protein